MADMMFYQGKNKLRGNKEERDGNGSTSQAKNNRGRQLEGKEFPMERQFTQKKV